MEAIWQVALQLQCCWCFYWCWFASASL